MRKIILLPALLLAFVFRLPAQVEMELVLDQDQFLRSESLPVRVRITNLSGQTLHLGKDPDWLSFMVNSGNGVSLPRAGDGPVTRPFDLESSKTATLQADLTQYFNLSEEGHYTVSAKANFQQLSLEVGAKPKTFSINVGIKLWASNFGIPQTDPPQIRKYALQQASFLKVKKIYARVTDVSEARVYRVVNLGSLVSISQPEALVDQSSNLHVLFQDDSRTFSYTIVNPNGEIIIRRTYEYSETRPRLRADENGLVHVSGGARRVMPNDLPPARVVPAPTIPSTNPVAVPK